jgi:hypothetical protein
MIQILPVGKGVVLAVPMLITSDRYEAMRTAWEERMPDVPMVVVSPARIVTLPGGAQLLFEFTGDVTPTLVAEFRRWWEEVSQPLAQSGTISEPSGRPPGHDGKG